MFSNTLTSWPRLLSVLALTACATVQPSGTWPSANYTDAAELQPARLDRNWITKTEIHPEMQSAYDIVAFRRPEWLVARGMYPLMDGRVETPTVYLDGVRYGNCEALKTITAMDVGEVRYLDGLDATTRFGAGNRSGAILVTTRRR